MESSGSACALGSLSSDELSNGREMEVKGGTRSDLLLSVIPGVIASLGFISDSKPIPKKTPIVAVARIAREAR
jgi:hypothetical protein